MTIEATQRAGVRQWVGLGLLALPTILLGLDVTVLYLALPSLAADLAPSATQTLWIMDAYGLLIGGFLVTMGTLGDRVGRRRLLMIGMAAFGAASVFAAFAPSAELLIAARVLLGIAGATLMPSTLSLISNMFPDPRERAVAIGFWATMFALGMAGGPIIGGVLVDAFWWGAAFLLAVPVGVIVLIGARPLLPEYANPSAGRIDVLSVGLSLAALLPLIAAVKHVATTGVDVHGGVLAIIGVVASVLFVRRQRRLDSPLLDVALFGSRSFAAALAVLLIGLIGVGGTMYLVTQYFQLVEEYGPFEAGLWMGPPAGAMFLAAIAAPLLARRIRPGIVMGYALIVSVVGYAVLATAGLDDGVLVAVGFGLIYFGLGAIAALGTDIVIGVAPASKAGSAASLSETVQELGVAVGVATFGSAATVVYRAQVSVDGQVGTVSSAVADSLSAAMMHRSALSDEALVAAKEAFVAGLNASSLIGAIIVAGAAGICLVFLRFVPVLGAAVSAQAGR